MTRFATNGGVGLPNGGTQATTMTERSVSDLVFRDIEPDLPAGGSHEDRVAALREELVKLRPADPGPRVIPAAEAADRRP
jgi:hypothetical protein